MSKVLTVDFLFATPLCRFFLIASFRRNGFGLFMIKKLLGCFMTLHAAAFGITIEVGSPAPQVSGVTDEGQNLELASLYKKGFTLVYFYPKADTPGCTKQACSLRDSYQQLQEKGVQILGVSTDSVADQKAFKNKFRLPFTLIADENKEWAKAFGVPVTLGFASRQAFLMKDGKVVWLDRTASTAKQADDVLAYLASATGK